MGGVSLLGLYPSVVYKAKIRGFILVALDELQLILMQHPCTLSLERQEAPKVVLGTSSSAVKPSYKPPLTRLKKQ